MEGMQAVGGVVMLMLGLLILVIAVLWILMPFAIFGTKDVLRQILAEQKKTNEILIAEAKRVRARDGYKPDESMSDLR